MTPTQAIKIALIKKGLTLRALAQKIGRHESYLSELVNCYQRGRRNRRGRHTRLLIADALGVPYEDLWTDEPSQSSKARAANIGHRDAR